MTQELCRLRRQA